jgi:hypothetical protein
VEQEQAEGLHIKEAFISAWSFYRRLSHAEEALQAGTTVGWVALDGYEIVLQKDDTGGLRTR